MEKKESVKSKVVRIEIGVLYNRGNYEHVSYKLTAEVPEGGSAKSTMLDLAGILAALKPIKLPFDYETMSAACSKESSALNAYETEHISEWRERVSEIDHLRRLKKEALERLDQLGGTCERRFPKDNDEDTLF